MKTIRLNCKVHESFNVSQVGGMFDVEIAKKAERVIPYESPPGLSDDWSIGCIVGPSGSGKSSVAWSEYGDGLYAGGEWSDKKAVVDCFGEMPVKEIVSLLTLVGFSSPSSWIKPYPVLSNGEKFRCDLARAMSGGSRRGRLVVFDEGSTCVPGW